MNKNVFDEQVGRLQKVFNGKYDQESLILLWRDNKGFKDECISAAVDELINSRPVKLGLPTNYDISKAIYGACERDWDKKKGQEQRYAHDFFNKPKSRAHKDFITLINRRLSGGLDDNQQYYQAMIDIGKKYPGANMDENAEDFKQSCIKTVRWVNREKKSDPVKTNFIEASAAQEASWL